MKILGKILKWGGFALVVLIIGYVLSMSSIFHTPPVTSIVRLAPGPGASKAVLVAGATSSSGVELVKVLRERGYEVFAMVRASSNTAQIDSLGLGKVMADAMQPDEVTAALASRHFDAVISLLGTSSRDLPARTNPIMGLLAGPTPMDPNKRPDFIGNRNVIDAAKAAGVSRFVLVTVIGAGNSGEAVPPGARRGHSTVIPLKTQAEDHLRASGLEWTIIRPGGLGKQPPDTTAVLVDDPEAFSFMSRSDLGRLTADALGDASTIGKTYTAYDPERRMLWKLFTAK